MDHEDDYDQLPLAVPSRRTATKASGALAVRALLQRLAWVDAPLVYWTGTAMPVAPAGTTRSVQQRLLSLPPGPYAVRVRSAAVATHFRVFSDLLDALAPVIEDVVRVDLSLIARSLRRLQDARRFPHRLPKLVGDVGVWQSRCGDALGRARALLDAVAAEDVETIGRVAVVIGRWPTSRTSSPPAADKLSSPSVLKRRAAPARPSPSSPATSSPAVAALRQSLSAWPDDVCFRLVDRVGAKRVARLYRDCPAVNSDEVAAAVRDRLLLSPSTIDSLLDGLPDLLRLAERLSEEPRRRLLVAVRMQRDALDLAVTNSGVSGNPLRYAGRLGSKENQTLQRLAAYYQNAVEAALSEWYGPDLLSTRPMQQDAINSVADPISVVRGLVLADRLRSALLDRPIVGRIRQQVVRWKGAGSRAHLIMSGERAPVDFSTLPEVASRVLWESARPAPASFHRSTMLSLAAIDAVGDIAAFEPWVEACCHAWPLGPHEREHGEAVALALYSAHAGVPPAVRPQVQHVVATLAEHLVLVSLSSASGNHGSTPQHRLLETVRFVSSALSAGLTAEDVIKAVRAGHVAVLRSVLKLAPDRLKRFHTWMGDLDRRVTAGAERPESVRVNWNLSGSDFGQWGLAYLFLGSQLLTRMVDLLIAAGVSPQQSCAFIATWACWLSDESSLRFVQEMPLAEKLNASRERVSAALPALRLLVRRVVRQHPDRVAAAGEGFCACLEASRLSLGDKASAAAVAQLASACMTVLRRRGGNPAEAVVIFEGSGDLERRTFVALALGKPDRLVSLGVARLDLNWSQMMQVEEAWRQIARIEPLAECLSSAVCRDNRRSRVLRLLDRLGLAVRLSRGEDFRQSLASLFETGAPDNAAAVYPLGGEGLSASHHQALDDLRRWRADGTLPERIAATLSRTDSLAREYALLQDRPDLTPAARRRMDHLRRMVDDRAALADWVRRDLDKHLPGACEDALLERLEQMVASAIAAHFAGILSRPVPSPRSPREERNWDNALRLYFSVEKNRHLLRRLLRHEAVGDRTWVLKQPQNLRFLATVRSAGVDVEAWLSPLVREVESPGGRLRIEVETDPLHVLQMGNYFETCLSEGDINAFSTVANAIELNKRVIYVYDDVRDVVVGRKLLVLTEEGEILGFCSYGRMPKRAGDTGEAGSLKGVLDAFCHELARRCGARLHKFTSDQAQDELYEANRFSLFAQWYNDGPEPFEAQWLKETVRRRKPRPSKGRRSSRS